jgi:4a-hydroxytetrahydrobiopterin dehydratase
MTAPKHWSISGKSLSRTFITENYDASFELALEIKEIADELEHHPDILLSYNAVAVTTTTHDEDSLTDKDYELAESINDIYDAEDEMEFNSMIDDDLDDEDDFEEDDDNTDMDIEDEDVY